MTDSMNIFDRRLSRLHRDRAAAGLAQHDFLLREIAGRLVDTAGYRQQSFPLVLDLGCHGGEWLRRSRGARASPALVQCDSSFVMARQAARNGTAEPPRRAEDVLPFAPESFDLALSNLSLHWVNDLPGCLLQIRQTLKPDGLFLAAMLGGATLQELRDVLMEAELAVSWRRRSAGLALCRSQGRRRPAAAGRVRPAGGRFRQADRDLRGSAGLAARSQGHG